ncbi:hypothetical protein FGB62_174g08 [Gracilaria domingensis]|nr:hypothetical protein FGB62_174g08 [Gracilaria domingensis]
MREFADTSGSPMITSMQAPGTDIYNVFDTVCVLDQGRVFYFGPWSEAENYFKSVGFFRPPQRSVPEFVDTVTNPVMRDEYLKSAAHLSSLKQPPPLRSQEFAERIAQGAFSTQLRAKVDDAEALAPEVIAGRLRFLLYFVLVTGPSLYRVVNPAKPTLESRLLSQGAILVLI